jgi:hypothetical protein
MYMRWLQKRVRKKEKVWSVYRPQGRTLSRTLSQVKPLEDDLQKVRNTQAYGIDRLLRTTLRRDHYKPRSFNES